MKTFAIGLLIILHSAVALPQSISERSVKGYRHILELRFRNPSNWSVNIESNLTQLVQVVLSKENKLNILIPVRIVTEHDTSVVICHSKDLGKYFKRRPISFSVDSTVNAIATQRLSLRELRTSRSEAYFDSVFHRMENNALVNCEKLSSDEFLNTNSTTVCCRPRNYPELLATIYSFFTNGILLREDTFDGSLHYLPY